MAIIPEQQVQTSTLRGVDPTQFLQQAYREQQANVAAFKQMNAAIQQETQKFIQKQEEKKQKEMTYSAILPYIQQMSGGDAKQADALAKHLANNQVSSKAILNIVQMSQEQEAKAKDQRALRDAIAASQIAGGGGTDWSSVPRAYAELGGSNLEAVSKFVDKRTSAAKPVTGRLVNMDELNKLRDAGYKPKVEFGANGEMIMTDMSTFAPDDGGAETLTKGQEKMLEATAADLAPWGTGGKQQAEANLATYDKLIAGLASGDITTRGFADLTPQALGIDDTLRQLINPTGQDAVDNVRRVIFQGLKDALGAQFTQREAERLVAASYNPALPEEMNIKRLQDARNVLADVIQSKNDLYQHIAQGGTMANYQGVAPAAVLSSGINEVQTKYSDGGLGSAGFQAPSGLTIRELKSNRPTK